MKRGASSQAGFARAMHGRKSMTAMAAVLAAISVTPVYAQTPSASETGTETAQSGGIADIVVTARRRAESAQSIPLAVSAVSAEQLQTLNIVRLDALEKLAPSLRVTQASGSGNAPAIFIRGVGTQTTALYAEPSVGLYIDGVYSPRGTANTFDLPDIQSVQVLRGPQGTLFGRNTTGGAILLTTRDPTDEAGAKVDVGYGTNQEINASAVVQFGKLGGSPFAIKITGATHSRNGWVNTPGHARSEWGGALNTQSIGGAIKGEIAPGFTIDNRIRYNHVVSYTSWEAIGGSVNGRAYFGRGPLLGGPAYPIGLGPRDVSYRDPRTSGRSVIKSWGDSLTLTYEASPALTLKSITGYSEIHETLRGNLGGGYTLGVVANPVVPGQVIEPVSAHTTPFNPGKAKQLTQEFQAYGDLGDFNYLAGLYYFREKTFENVTVIINSPLSATSAIRLNRSSIYNITSKSYAAFGQIGWKPQALDGRLEVTGGVRYTKDDKALDSIQIAKTIATTTVTQSRDDSWDNVGWSGSISYKIMPDVMFYARAASAYRSGGYNGTSVGAPPFDPETATTFEGGVKADLFDRHLRYNASIFQTNYDDLQVNGYNQDTKSNAITNAGKARFRGFEVETTVVFGGFQVDGNAGYVKPVYKRYIFAIGGIPTDVADIAKFPYVPKWTYHVGAQYGLDTGSIGKFTVRGDYSGTSNSFAYSIPLVASSPNFAQLLHTGRESNLSARLLWDYDLNGHKLRAQVFGENLSNHRYVSFVTDFSSILSGSYNRPRRYGVSVGYEF